MQFGICYIEFAVTAVWKELFSTIDWTQWGATTPELSEPGSDGNKRVLWIPQSSSITTTSLSDCLVPFPGHSLGCVLTLCKDVVSEF